MKKFYSLHAAMVIALMGAYTTSAHGATITEVPTDAQVRTYISAGNLFTTFWGATFPVDEDMLPGEMAFDGNTVYWKNPIETAKFGTYIKGSIEGDKITFEFPQQISSTRYVNRMVNTSTTEGQWTYALEKDVPNKLTFTLSDDGFIAMDETSYDVILGCTDADGGWTANGVYALTFTPFDKKLVELPAGVVAENWTMTRDGNSYPVEVAVADKTVYVKGMSERIPEAWVEGTLENGKVTFESGQYIGVDGVLGYLMLMYGVAPNSKTIEPAFVMEYDETIGIMTAENSVLFCAGEVFKDMVAFQPYNNVMIVRNREVTDFTPAAPQITDVQIYPEFPNQGWDCVDVNLSIVNLEGQLLDTNNLYYRILLDGEPYILSPDDFEGLEGPTEWIPYDFECYDLEQIGGTGRSVSIYISGPSVYSVQEKYVDGDTEYLSETVSWTVSGVSLPGVSAEKVGEIYTDLAGRRVANPQGGIYIRTTVYSDGSTQSSKISLK